MSEHPALYGSTILANMLTIANTEQDLELEQDIKKRVELEKRDGKGLPRMKQERGFY